MAVETKTEIESLADIIRLVRENFNIKPEEAEERIILTAKEHSLRYEASNMPYKDIDERMKLLMPQLKKIDNLIVVYKSQKQWDEEFMECLRKGMTLAKQTEPRPESGEYTFEVHGIFRSRTLLFPYQKRLDEELKSLEGLGLDTTRAVYLFKAD